MTAKRKIQDINMPSRSAATKKPARKKAAPTTAKKTTRTTRVKAKATAKKTPTRRRATVKKAPTRKSIPKTYVSSRRMQRHSPLVGTMNENSNSGSAGVLWAVAFVMLLILAYVVSASFSKASVQVTLKEQVLSVNTNLTFHKDGVQDDLDFDTVVFDGAAEKEMQDVPMEQVFKKASGKIVVYNDYSSKSQRLIEETRFEDPNGRIYKIGKGEGIIVPGQKTVDGEKVPGSIEVMVYADEPGPFYNQGPTDFVIPGFRGGPKFSGFYARSVADITGGEIGERPNISEEEMLQTVTLLKDEITNQAINEASYRIPEGYLALEDSVYYEWRDLEFDSFGDGNVLIRQEADINTSLVKRDEVAFGLLESLSFELETMPQVEIVNLSELDFSISSSTENIMTVNIKGDARVRWVIDEAVIKRVVAGVRKKDFAEVLSSRPEIKSAQTNIKPIWINRLPKRFDNIEVFFRNIDR